jgi:hypothetical protein
VLPDPELGTSRDWPTESGEVFMGLTHLSKLSRTFPCETVETIAVSSFRVRQILLLCGYSEVLKPLCPILCPLCPKLYPIPMSTHPAR